MTPSDDFDRSVAKWMRRIVWLLPIMFIVARLCFRDMTSEQVTNICIPVGYLMMALLFLLMKLLELMTKDL